MENNQFLNKTAAVGLRVKENAPLAPHTTWKIGGPARYFYQVTSADEAETLVRIASEFGVEIFSMGHGSNVLISDEGFDGLVMQIKISELAIKGSLATAGSGFSMGALAVRTLNAGLAGLEWAVGLPGTVGGAVYANSKCFGGSTGKNLRSAKILDASGTARQVQSEYFNFSYDYSVLQQTGEIVLEATFVLDSVKAESIQTLREKIAALAAERIKAQPLGKKTAGSVFKALEASPATLSALKIFIPQVEERLRDGRISSGLIIDEILKLKGHRLGKMQISPVHANFFVNLGGATAKNCKKLIDFVKKECKNKTGIVLEEEIRYIGRF